MESSHKEMSYILLGTLAIILFLWNRTSNEKSECIRYLHQEVRSISSDLEYAEHGSYDELNDAVYNAYSDLNSLYCDSTPFD